MFWLFFRQKISIFESHSKKKGFDSLSQVQKKKFQVFEQFFSKVQFSQFFLNKAFNSLRHVQRKKGFNSLRRIQRQRIQFFASYSKKKGFNSLRRIQKKVQLFASYLKKELNSLTHIKKKINSLRHEKTILWVIFNESYWKTPILWLILNKKFNSLSHIWRKVHFLVLKKSVLWVKVKKVQFFESHFCLKNSILWVIFSRRFHSSNQIFFF